MNRGGRPISTGWSAVNVGDMTWTELGNCHNRPDLVKFFFPDPLARGADRMFSETEAKGRCLGLTEDVTGACPVRDECLEHALNCEEPAGVWGATSPAERKVLLRSRRVPSSQIAV